MAGPDVIERFAPYVDNAQVPEAELQALDQLFADLTRERISHGDLKGHNLFWQNGRWALIDLDAMAQHSSQASFAAAYAKDRARFLRNWPESSALHALLASRLP
jgi:Ser/Thr protein kinase RdoA (MazF antagonist)